MVYVTVTETYVGLDVERNSKGAWEVTKVDPIGWAGQRKVQSGDILTEVNQQSPDSYYSIQRYGVIGELNQMKILRNGNQLEYIVRIPLNYNTLLYHTLLPLLVYMVLFGFSFYVYWKKRWDPVAIFLIAFLLSVGIGYLSAGASARADTFARFVNSFSLMMVPVLFLHFHYQYFFKYQIRLIKWKMLVMFYIINLLVVISDTLSFFVYVGDMYELIRNVQLILFSFEILFGLGVLIYYYFRFRRTIHKPIFQNTIFSIVVSFFPFILLTALPSTLFDVELLPAPVTAVFLVFLPVFFLYLVLTNQVFDIDFINSRLRYYAFISLVLTGAIIGLVIFFTNLSYIQWARLTILIYGSLVLFFYLEEKFNVRGILFRNQFNFKLSLDRFSYDLAKILKKEELDQRLIQEIKEVLPVENVSILKFNKKEKNVRLLSGDAKYSKELIEMSMVYNESMLSIGTQFFIQDGLCSIISEQHDSINALWIERKVNHTSFNHDEQHWLKTLVHYTGIVYENFQLIEGVTEELNQSLHNDQSMPSWMLRLLFNLSEKERARLSYDLHDSALQEQLIWYRKVEALLEEGQVPEQLGEDLIDLREGLLGVVKQIRETCTLLRPPFLKETGIVEALSYLIQSYQARESFSIHFVSQDFKSKLGNEQALAIYRIVQELLNNASKHSNANDINIELKSEGNCIIMSYKDDGIGLPAEDQYKSTQSMGLTGIRQRVNSVHGDMEIFSSENSGVEVAILLQSDREIKNYFDIM